MPRNAHQVGYRTEDKIVTIRGVVGDVPFGVEVDANKKTAHILNDTAFKARTQPTGKKKEKSNDDDCPGCPNALKKLFRGGVGFAKAVLRIDQVPPEVAAGRKALCLLCPAKCYDFGICRDDWPNRDKSQQGCGCILALKILQGKESCPHEHWGSHE